MRGVGEAERGGHRGGRGPAAAQHVQRGQVGDGELHARHCRTITGMDAAAVETRLTTVLGAWAAASVVLGGVLAAGQRTRGFGRQTAAWGAVDGAIAAVGVRNRRRRGPTDPARLRRVLLVNAGLDVGTSRWARHCCAAGGAATARPCSSRARSCSPWTARPLPPCDRLQPAELVDQVVEAQAALESAAMCQALRSKASPWAARAASRPSSHARSPSL